MWGRLKRKFSRTKGCEAKPDEGKEIVSNKLKMPNSSLAGSSADEACLSNQGNQSDDCKCGPLLQLQKHFFGSFRTRKDDDLSAKGIPEALITVDNMKTFELEASQLTDVTKSFPQTEVASDCQNVALLDAARSEFNCGAAQNGSAVAQDCLDVKEERCEPSLTLKVLKSELSTDDVSVVFNNQSQALSDHTDPKLSPPKMKRREKGLAPMIFESVRKDESVEKSEELVTEVHKNSAAALNNRSYGHASASARTVCDIGGHKGGTNCEPTENGAFSRSDDAAESMDSGNHPSEGDVEKGHSSPDLELEDFSGRESGYTTLDDVQPASYPDSVRISDTVVSISGVMRGRSRAALNPVSERLQFLMLGDLTNNQNEPADRNAGSDWLRGDEDPGFSGRVLLHGGRTSSSGYESIPFGEVADSGRYEHVDYIPADVSVSKIFEDPTNSSDVYASVPRPGKSDEKWVDPMVFSESPPVGEDLEDVFQDVTGGTEGPEAVIDVEPRDVPHCAFDGFGPADHSSAFEPLDSDDGEFVPPPLPSRNYEPCLTSASCFGTRAITSPWFSEEKEERIHMTWEEVMNEAKCLGIPLCGPVLDNSKSVLTRGSSDASTSEPHLKGRFSPDQSVPDTTRLAKHPRSDTKKKKVPTATLR